MRISILCLCFCFIHFFSFSQNRQFEIFGKIDGEYKDRIYLFYDNDFTKRDSISAAIINHRFYFRLKAKLPILCRLHFGGKTNIQEFYVDNSKTFISLVSKLADKNVPDSIGGARVTFEVINVTGSKTEDLKRSFEKLKLQSDKAGKTVEEKHSEQFTTLQSFVAKYPKSKASAYVIAGRIFIMGHAFMFRGNFPFTYSETKQLMSLLDTSLYKSLEWENLSKLLNSLDLERHKIIGNSFYDVILKDTSYKNVDTKNLKGKYVLVDFWASWCGPCRILNPELKVLYEKYREKGFEIIGISLDTEKNSWKRAIDKDNLPWKQLNDGTGFNGALAKYYDINGVPLKIILNEKREIVGFDLSMSEIKSFLTKL